MRLDGQEGITHHSECHHYHQACAIEKVDYLRKENANLKAELTQAQAALAMAEDELARRQTRIETLIDLREEWETYKRENLPLPQ